MPNLVLMRHSESYTNAENYIAPDSQNLLTIRGIRHTLDNAKAFRTVRSDYHFDVVFVSPLARTVHTAYTFLSGFGNKPVDITLVPEIVERKFGFKCFSTFTELREKFGDTEVSSWELDMNARPGESGENLQEVYDRSVAFYKGHVIPQLKDGKRVLVVAH